MALADTIGGKVAGELIRHTDWNTLVEAVDKLTADFQAFQISVNTQLTSLDSRLDTVEGDLNAFRTRVENFFAQQYRVTLETTRGTYAIGEQVEIVARVTDLFGSPVVFNNANRPWIDFVSTWGQLKPVSGFETRGGEGEHAVSVRVNLEGIARVRLRAEHVNENDEDEDEVVSALNVAVAEAANRPIYDLIVNAVNPSDAMPAYRAMSLQYDEVAPVRNYVDRYYTYTSLLVDPNIYIANWNDYRTTVVAFAKADSDPLTPDAGRGYSSIQVTFRDWIYPWAYLDYLNIEPAAPPVLDLGSLFDDIFVGDLDLAIHNSKILVDEHVRPEGIFARQKDYIVLDRALGRVTVENPAALPVVQSVKNGVSVQQSLEIAQRGQPLGAGKAGFDAVTTGIGFSGEGVAALGEQFGGLQQELAAAMSNLEGITSQMQSLENIVSAHGGQLQALLSDTGPIRGIQDKVLTVENQVGQFLSFNPEQVTRQTAKVNELDVQMNQVLEFIGSFNP